MAFDDWLHAMLERRRRQTSIRRSGAGTGTTSSSPAGLGRGPATTSLWSQVDDRTTTWSARLRAADRDARGHAGRRSRRREPVADAARGRGGARVQRQLWPTRACPRSAQSRLMHFGAARYLMPVRPRSGGPQRVVLPRWAAERARELSAEMSPASRRPAYAWSATSAALTVPGG